MKYILIFGLAMIISACSSTGYKKSGFTGGYKDKRLEDGRIELFYRGNGTNTPEQIESYWLRRASELCPDGFDILKKESTGQHNYYPIYSFHPRVEGMIKCK